MVVSIHLSWSSMTRWLRRSHGACVVTVYPRRTAALVRRDALVAGFAYLPWALLAAAAWLAVPHLRVLSIALLAAGAWQAGPRLFLGKGQALDLALIPQSALRLPDPVASATPPE